MIFLFPGQGSQRPGMGKDLFEAGGAARETLDNAARLLPDGFFARLFEGDAAALQDTRTAQPALLAVELAAAAHLRAHGVEPAVCAGHSLGELAALAVAGALALEDAIPLVCERARLMHEAAPEGGMAAVLGLAPDAIEAALPEGVQVANYNSPDQTIITGASAALAQAAEALKSAGAKRVMPLKVSGPFHSEHMRAAGDALGEYLKPVPLRSPGIRFVSSVSGEAESDPERIRALLARQLYSPVRWTAVMAAAGGGDALEAGPGNVLAGLAKRTPGAPAVRNAGTVKACAEWGAG